MDQTAIDARQQAALARNRAVLAVCAAGVAAMLVVLLAIADLDTPTVFGLGGLTAIVAALTVVTLDAWVGWRRPAPRVEDGAVVVRAHPAPFVAIAVAAAGLAMIALSFLLEPGGPGAVSDGRRAGLLAYVVVVAAPLLLLAALVLLMRTDRVVLDADEIRVRRAGRTRGVPWDGVRDVVPLPDNPGLVLRIEAIDGSQVLLPTRQLDLTTCEMRGVLRHYLDDPAAREGLAHAASLHRIQQL